MMSTQIYLARSYYFLAKRYMIIMLNLDHELKFVFIKSNETFDICVYNAIHNLVASKLS
jgi:hypothetical protein